MHKILSGTKEVSPHLIPKPVEGITRAGAQKKLPYVSSNTKLHRVSFIPRTTRDWNALPIAARLDTRVDGFKAAIDSLIPTSPVQYAPVTHWWL